MLQNMKNRHKPQVGNSMTSVLEMGQSWVLSNFKEALIDSGWCMHPLPRGFAKKSHMFSFAAEGNAI